MYKGLIDIEEIKLQKFLAESGIASRRKAEELIAAGRVSVNGVTANIGDRVDPEKDRVMIGKKAVRYRGEVKSYFMLYKPRGYVTTLKDEEGRRCITDLIKGISQRVYPVGRLDRDSEGLLILTNDGDLTLKLTHPAKRFPKTYRVTVRGELKKADADQLTKGVTLDDGYTTDPCEIRMQNFDGEKTVLYMTIYEGKNRQIRRMLDTVGAEVVILKRIAYGPIRLSGVKLGGYRLLTDEEVRYLRSI